MRLIWENYSALILFDRVVLAVNTEDELAVKRNDQLCLTVKMQEPAALIGEPYVLLFIMAFKGDILKHLYVLSVANCKI